MNTKTQAMWETLKPGLPYAWVPVLFVWIAWTMITTMNGQTPAVVNFILSSLLSIMLTVAAVLVQYCIVSAAQGVWTMYQHRLREIEYQRELAAKREHKE